MAVYGNPKPKRAKRYVVNKPKSKPYRKSPYKKSNAKVKNANLKF